MRKENIRNSEQLVAYLMDCNLATVCGMASLKSSKKGELKRQILIAQHGIDKMNILNIHHHDTRVEDVRACESSVEKWAEQFKPKK